MGKQFTLGRRQRLKSRKAIEALFSKGKRITVYPYTVLYRFAEKEALHNGPALQCGTGAASRVVKKAVQRNRIKRLTREAWRLQQSPLALKMQDHPCCLQVFFIYTAKEQPLLGFVTGKLGVIIQKLLIIADENHTAGA